MTNPAPLMLGVSGCRGVVSASLTPTVVAEFAGSFGAWLQVDRLSEPVSRRGRERDAGRPGASPDSGLRPEPGSESRSTSGSESRPIRPRVVLAADGRAGYQAVHAAATAGLLAAGCDVIDLGVAMTPTAGVMVDHLGADAGVVLTASHNPQEWNGLKFLLRDGWPGRAVAAGVDPPTGVGGQRLVVESDPHGPRAGPPAPAGGSTPAGATLRGGVSAAAPDAATADAIIARFRSGGAARLASWGHVGRARVDQTGAGVHVGRVVRALDALREGGRAGGDSGTLGSGRPALSERVRARAFTVVLDSVNGAGRHPGRVLLERLGCRVIALGDEDGGIFWHTPEPTRENLAAVSARVREAGADVAFCQDPDADRLAILAGDGLYIGEEYTLALAARAVLELGGGGGGGLEGRSVASGATVAGGGNAGGSAVLAANLSTSRMIDDVAAGFGGRVVRTAVGEANVVAAMKREGSPIGGEGNGGVIWPAVTYVRDSLGAMALVLGLMAATGRTLRELIAGIPSYAIEKRKVDIASKEAARPAVQAVERQFRGRADARIDTQDGVRVDLRTPEGDAWVHVRASNTEPIMRLIAEAPSAGGAGALLDETAAAMRL